MDVMVALFLSLDDFCLEEVRDYGHNIGTLSNTLHLKKSHIIGTL